MTGSGTGLVATAWRGLPATIRLGTRGSALARAQSGQVAEALRAALGVEVELVTVTTHGDVDARALAQLGGTGVFVTRLRAALADGRVDVAVHSLKDLPTDPAPEFTLAAVPAREDARDALVSAGRLPLHRLPAGARVGTGSPRRAVQLAALRPDLAVVGIRGNIDSRVAAVGAGVDAVLLAAAGLRRIGRIGEAAQLFDVETLVPAPGQGALAVECRAGDGALAAALAEALDDGPTRATVAAERGLLRALEAGCSAPVGAYARTASGGMDLHAVVGMTDGVLLRDDERAEIAPVGGPGDLTEHPAAGLGRLLAARLLEQAGPAGLAQAGDRTRGEVPPVGAGPADDSTIRETASARATKSEGTGRH